MAGDALWYEAAQVVGITNALNVAADVTVFDPRTVKDESTYPDPHRYPTGIPYVIVNGAVVVDGGRMSSARVGRVLRRPT